jgi:hypothetical protein
MNKKAKERGCGILKKKQKHNLRGKKEKRNHSF